MTDVLMPQMGESIAEGTITKWMKRVGERVERDEPLFEISTDKVDAEIPAPVSGVVAEIRFEVGDTVAIHTTVAVIADSLAAGASPAAPPEPATGSAPTQPAPAGPARPAGAPGALAPSAPAGPAGVARAPVGVPASVPAAVQPPSAQPAPRPAAPSVPLAGTTVPAASGAAAQSQAPRQPAQPTAPVPPQPPAPSPAAQVAAPGHTAVVPTASVADATPTSAISRPEASASAEELRLTRSSPVVRRIASEHGIDIREVPGRGLSGRVTKQDILEHMAGKTADATPPPSEASIPGPTSRPGAAELVPMSPIRRKTAERMVESMRTSAHVTTVFEIDMTRVAALKEKHRQSFEARGARLTYLPFIVKATVDALKAFPVLNASIQADSIAYHKGVNIGLAVALDWGLIVPVIHAADEKNILGLARSMADLADRARAKKLTVAEVQGGTFSITNPGVFGSLFGTPIIPQPQVAILCVGTIEKRPVVRDDAIAIRTMAYFALTFDHRLVDGADADRFMAHVKRGLQEFDESGL